MEVLFLTFVSAVAGKLLATMGPVGLLVLFALLTTLALFGASKLKRFEEKNP